MVTAARRVCTLLKEVYATRAERILSSHRGVRCLAASPHPRDVCHRRRKRLFVERKKPVTLAALNSLIQNKEIDMPINLKALSARLTPVTEAQAQEIMAARMANNFHCNAPVAKTAVPKDGENAPTSDFEANNENPAE